jgi:myo-inositol-1(or 4)-monophosphatase
MLREPQGKGRRQILRRIEEALKAAASAITPFLTAVPEIEFKSDKDPVTEADRTLDRILRKALLKDGEGWLSEESADDLGRLGKERVWVVDPIDGTREFVSGIPEWCISVGFVENRRAVAGGICNPVTGELFVGAAGEGVKLNGCRVSSRQCRTLKGATVLASRSEVERGDWDRFRGAPFVTQPMGSIAYKLAMVAAGNADATWTFTPKHEWDVAAGSALINAGGGYVRNLDGSDLQFNNEAPLFRGLLACSSRLQPELSSWLRERIDRPLESDSQFHRFSQHSS